MTLNKMISLLIALTMSAMIFTACTEDDPVDPIDKYTPKAPSNLKATSLDAESVLLRWDHSSDVAEAEFAGYKLDISPGTFATMNIAKNQPLPYKVEGLQEGTVYEFTLVAYSTEGEQSTSIKVSWAPASRFTQTVNNEAIRVYETASDFGSGLDLFFEGGGGNPDGPRTLTIASSADWDLGLRTVGTDVIFGSATKLGYTYGNNPQVAQVADKYWVASTLNDVFDSEALDQGATFQELAINLVDLDVNNNAVFVVRKYEPGQTRYNYAKVLLKRVGNSFLQGSSPNRYIELEISYQSTPDVPYAKVPEVN